MHHPGRAGMTLVEVVAGLALLGTLLAAVLVARARFVRLAADADRRLRAMAAADTLLVAWHNDPRSLPRYGAGRVDGDLALAWRTTPSPNPQIEQWRARVIRLEVLDDRPDVAAGRVLASVEFVVPEVPSTAAGGAGVADAGAGAATNADGAARPGRRPTLPKAASPGKEGTRATPSVQ